MTTNDIPPQIPPLASKKPMTFGEFVYKCLLWIALLGVSFVAVILVKECAYWIWYRSTH